MNKKEEAQGGKRIALASDVYALLEAEVVKFKQKGSHFKLNEAKLVGVLIEIFCAKYIERERKMIEAKFFDKKSYLKALIEKSTSEEELSESLNNFFSQSKVKKEKRVTSYVDGPGAPES